MLKWLLGQFFRVGGFHGATVLMVYRTGNFIYYRVHILVLRQIMLFFYYFVDYLLVRTLLNCEIPAGCRIGRNLRLPHGGKGIVIDKNAVIGDNVTLFHQVTIGRQMSDKHGSPVIGDDVLIGTGAKIVGPVTIGDHSKIGANAVVVRDVPPNSTAVGIPARIIVIGENFEAATSDETTTENVGEGHVE